MTPRMILHTNHLIPEGAAAISLGPFILVRPEFAGDAGLLAHEKVHQSEQLFTQAVYWLALFGALAAAHAESPWWLLAFLMPPWWVAYLLVPRFRLQAELRAYRKQMQVGGINAMQAAHYLSTLYRLDLTYGQAFALVTEGMA